MTALLGPVTDEGGRPFIFLVKNDTLVEKSRLTVEDEGFKDSNHDGGEYHGIIYALNGVNYCIYYTQQRREAPWHRGQTGSLTPSFG